jgi:hypothetical protein
MRATAPAGVVSSVQSRYLACLLVFAAAALWLTVIVGTYVTFPPYRATPPRGLADLGEFPRSFLQSNPGTVWLHAFAMEIKEHVPWIAAMLATSVAFVASGDRTQILTDARINRAATGLVSISLVLGSAVGILGIFVNKVAPLE